MADASFVSVAPAFGFPSSAYIPDTEVCSTFWFGFVSELSAATFLYARHTHARESTTQGRWPATLVAHLLGITRIEDLVVEPRDRDRLVRVVGVAADLEVIRQPQFRTQEDERMRGIPVEDEVIVC